MINSHRSAQQGGMRKFLLLIAAVFAVPVAAPAHASNPPRLVVVISVDQFAADLFDEYRGQFTGGLARLAQGAVFRNGYQGQAATETCPGHSTMLTGVLPARSGIIANEWVDQSAARADKHVYCAEDESVPGSTSAHYTVSSVHLEAPTLGDLMKKRSPASRNVAVSGKDRAAVMMSGHDVDQRWYWDGTQFVTDLAHAPAMPGVVAINQSVERLVAAPEPPLEPTPFCMSRSAPITLSNGRIVGNGRFQRAAGDYGAFTSSPAMDGATLALAARLVGDMKLGQGPATDLLSIGLSATDHIGHEYGPEGQEQCLNLLSLDRDLAGFFQVLDASHIDYAVVLTADHGIQPIPERAKTQHPEAARADPRLSAALEGKAIGQDLGLGGPVLFGGTGGDVWVDRSLSPAQQARAEAEAIRFYSGHPQVAAVFTRPQLEKVAIPSGDPAAWTLEQRARASFDARRSGDLVVLLKPWITAISAPGASIATHGSAWDYDRRVPILFWRPGMAASEHSEGVEAADIMPTLAAMIGVPLDSARVDGHCLSGIDTVDCPAN